MTESFFDLTNPNFLGIVSRFAVHIIVLIILIRIIYYRYNRKEKFLFSFFLMGILAFFITSILLRVTIEMGMGLGLVAVLAILRLRARNFSVKDMAYTFVVFGLSVLNALKVFNFPYFGILIINSIILLSAFLLEIFIINHRSEMVTITYENIDMLRPEKKQKLLKDVSELTGKTIIRIKVRRIDYKSREAILDVCYKD